MACEALATTVENMTAWCQDAELSTPRGVDALVAMGYDLGELVCILQRWRTWDEWSSCSWEERARALGHRGHVHVPQIFPELREASFGEIVSYTDPNWPRALGDVQPGIGIVEMNGRPPERAVAVSGAEWPSGRGVAVAQEVARLAGNYGYDIVAVDRGIGRAAVREARRMGAGYRILYGDAGLQTARGCLGGVQERAVGGTAMHLRGTSGGTSGMQVATRVAVALSQVVILIEPGAGRSPGVEAAAAAATAGKPCLLLNGGTQRGEYDRADGTGLAAGLAALRDVLQRTDGT